MANVEKKIEIQKQVSLTTQIMPCKQEKAAPDLYKQSLLRNQNKIVLNEQICEKNESKDSSKVVDTPKFDLSKNNQMKNFAANGNQQEKEPLAGRVSDAAKEREHEDPNVSQEKDVNLKLSK